MSASPKSKRGQPTRRFEDYILTYEVGPESGLYPIQSSQMNYVDGDAGLPYADDYSTIQNLGFNFQIDGKSYNNLYVSTNGWAVLIDSQISASSFYIGDVINTAGTGNNHAIRDAFTNNHMLLAPWFDDIRNIFRDLSYSIVKDSHPEEALNYYVSIFGTTTGSLDTGKSLIPPGIDSTAGGVKYFRGNSSSAGQFIVIRWKSFTSYNNPFNIINFDLVLYESGMLEFRYAPRNFQKIISYEGATIGIFSYGGSTGSPRYRDFGGILKKDMSDLRANYENGGAIYKSPFFDTNNYQTAKYTISLNSFEHWPGGGQTGAIFRFSPPRLRRRQNRSIVSLRDSESFVNRTERTYFDDRYTIPLPQEGVKAKIEYPTMLPVGVELQSSGDPFSLIELHRSGSIVVERNGITHGLYDDVLHDSILDGKRRSGK